MTMDSLLEMIFEQDKQDRLRRQDREFYIKYLEQFIFPPYPVAEGDPAYLVIPK